MSAPGQTDKTCPKCGFKNSFSADSCLSCGHIIIDVSDSERVQAEQELGGSVTDHMPVEPPQASSPPPSAPQAQPQPQEQPYQQPVYAQPQQNPYGHQQQPYGQPHPGQYPQQQPYAPHPQTDSKSMLVAILLALFVGGLGIHRFYLGHTSTGLWMLVLWLVGFVTSFFLVGFVFLIAVGIWALVDLIMIATGSLTNADGSKLT